MEKVKKYLQGLGYSDKESNDIINSYPIINVNEETLLKNISVIYNFLNSLYTKDEIFEMIKIFPTLYSLSKENIKKKIDSLVLLGYAKHEVIKMTKTLLTLYGLSLENR